MGIAALTADYGDKSRGSYSPMQINLLVNSKGNVCLTHDEPFQNVPLWVKYLHLSRKIEILFDNGTSYTMSRKVQDELDSYLVNATKVHVVRTENNLPVEGYETFLLNDSYN